jgi:hypothetical protein
LINNYCDGSAPEDADDAIAPADGGDSDDSA